MALSSIAIIAGVAALTSSLFKNKETRVKDIIELSKISKENIDKSPQLKIAKNDINTHITGVKNPIFHEELVEIMAKHNKSVGYFRKLDGRIFYSESHQISIIKEKLRTRLKKEFTDINSTVSSLIYIITMLFILKLAIEMDGSTDTWQQPMAIILAAIGGMVLSQLFAGLAVRWHVSFHQVKDCEYQELFDEYANNKLDKLSLSKDYEKNNE